MPKTILSALKSNLLLIGMLVVFFVAPVAFSRADGAGEALFNKCTEAESKAQSIEAHFTHQFQEEGHIKVQSGTLLLKKPNLAHIVVTSSKKETTGDVVINSDGKRFITYSKSDNDFAAEPADIAGGNIARNNILETGMFFNPDMLNRLRSLASGVKVAGAVSVGTTQCKVLQFIGIPKVALKLYIGPDGIVRGATKVFNGSRDETHLTDVKVNSVSARTAFAWEPPHGAKTVQEVAASMEAKPVGEQAVSLLAVGKSAPDFTLAQYSGGNLTLSAEIKSHKVVLLNFWSLFCGPCREELPHLDKMQKELADKGVEIVTVNGGDNAANIAKFLKENGITLKAMMDKGKVETLFGVQAIPTNYVIGKDGKILGAFEGFDEAGIRGALAKAGIK